MFTSTVRSLLHGDVRLTVGSKARIRRELVEQMGYLSTHQGGGVTLTPDAYSSLADEYFAAWNKLNADGVFKNSNCAWLKRTPTGLELQMS